MHLHTHLRECLLDYGPFYGFWCFSYERFNGILEQVPYNNRSIEVQLMKRFAGDMEHLRSTLPEEYHFEFAQVFGQSKQVVGSVSEIFQESDMSILHADVESNWGMNSPNNVQLPTCFSRGALTASESHGLRLFFSRLYSQPLTDIQVNSALYRFKEITVEGVRLECKGSRSSTSSIVMASWYPHLFCEAGGEGDTNDSQLQDKRPVQINFFAKHIVTIKNTPITHIMFSASWFKIHPERSHYGKPLSIWECDIFEDAPVTYLIPL